MNTRLCEPGCPYPDLLHLELEPDWIGDTPIMHGERFDCPSPPEVDWWGDYCLCGHPGALLCPGYLRGEDGLSTLVIRRSDGAA